MCKFTPSQFEVFIKIKNQLNKFSRYHNYILYGKSGTGKTFLMKEISKELNGVYIDFEQDFGTFFLKEHDYKVVDESIVLKFIKEYIDKNYSDRVILIDCTNSIFNSLYEKERVKNFVDSYLRRTYKNKYIISLSELYLENTLIELYKNKFFKLNYSKNDNEFLSEKLHVPLVISENFKNGHYFNLVKHQGEGS